MSQQIHSLSPRQLFDLDLILDGAFSPLSGFMNEDDYRSVVETMRLAHGELFPIPVILDVCRAETPRVGDTISLTDTGGRTVATLKVESVYEPDRVREARFVYGTDDTHHFGVAYLAKLTHDMYVGGTLARVSRVPVADFHHLRRTPAEVKSELARRGWDTVLAFQTRNPMHRAHYEILTRAARAIDGNVLIHPVVGLTKDGDIDYATRTRAYEKLQTLYFGDRALLSLLPLAMRMAGPREALWHALIRKNYGATHFLIGRDHAGPGSDMSGTPFYPIYAAQELAKAHENELGIRIVTTPEMVYVENEARYLPADELEQHHVVREISGTAFRRMLREGLPIPDWFSFPEVIEELQRSYENAPEMTGAWRALRDSV